MNKTGFHRLDGYAGLQLRRLRNKKKYSLERVAEWLDLTKQQMSRLERGENRLSIVQLYQLSRGFNVPVSWFFEGFEDDADEVAWLGNMVGGDRSLWTASIAGDSTEKMLALWSMMPNHQMQKKAIRLLELMFET